MKTIHQLPNEILPEIFKNLTFPQLNVAQKVCRAWYRPAHLLLLRNIYLGSKGEIEKFIKTIDRNTDDSYLAAVQEIEIRNYGFVVNYQFDSENMEKLFYRFPNLTHIFIDSTSACFNELNEDSGQILAKKCPKLQQFGIHLPNNGNEREINCCRTMYKFRSLVTSMDLDRVGSASEFGGIVKFITSFPRLQRVWGGFHVLPKFKYCFPIFEQLAHLQRFSIKQDHDDNVEESFAEKQLARLSQEKQDLVTQRFSQVTVLAYSGDRIFCPNAIKFIAKYFTGLENLQICCYHNHRDWTNHHQQVLLNQMTSFSLKKSCDIRLGNMLMPVIAECLPIIENKLFSQFSSNRLLEVVVETKQTDIDKIDLRLTWPTPRQIAISFAKDLETYDTLTTLLNGQLINVDELMFHVQERRLYTNIIDINTYTTLLRALPMLKEAALDIPPSFMDSIPCTEIFQCTHMETLTLRGSFSVTIQNMLDSFALMLPNLKKLTLFDYKGVSSADNRDFYINLTSYSLERLELDMTPFSQAMKKRSIKNDFFVIVQIESLQSKEQYRISTDFSSVTKIEYDGGQDDWCVHIIVNSLQHFEGYMYRNDAEGVFDHLLLCRSYTKHIVVF